MQREIFTPPGGPPDIERPSPEIFAAMGDSGIRRMVHDFYNRLEKSTIRGMFPDDMHASADRSADYFVQLLGGPSLFSEKYGPPRLRARHIPFTIRDADRKVWLDCFDASLQMAVHELGFPREHTEGFRNFLTGFSGWMVNAR